MSKHPAFKHLARTAHRVFKERGEHFWRPYDHESQLPITLIFNDAYAPVDAAGVQIEEAQPTAFVLIEDARRLAPHRAQLALDVLFSNRDELQINGVTYAVESCRSDGYAQVEIKLYRKNDD